MSKVDTEELKNEIRRLIRLYEQTEDLEMKIIFEKRYLEKARQLGEICLQEAFREKKTEA